MPQSILLNIPEPCHENWHSMTPREQGRFCGSCQKVVVDFSVMTDKEVLDYFSKVSQQVCGRFSNDQLNKELIITPTKKRVTWAYVWNILVATLLMTKTYAQGKPQIRKEDKITIVEGERSMGLPIHKKDPVEAVIPVTMRGIILDAQTNRPVEGASINIKGMQIGTSADTTGKFLLQIKRKKNLVLECSAIGYETQTLLVDKTTNWKHVRVLLNPAFDELQTATIVGHPARKKCDTVGYGMVQYTLTPAESMNRFINSLIPAALKQEIKVFPNPVTRGYSIQVKLNLPQAGEYKLALLNTAGQVMHIQPLHVPTMEQLVDVDTQTKWSAGTYWIRISSTKTKKVFETRVLLQ